MLAAARLAAPRGIPILPINMGSLGFLTSFTLEELYPALEETLAGRFSVSQRVMLQVELERGGTVIESQCTLNDAVIHKGALARMIELELGINSEFVCRYRADGLIVSSPNGLDGLLPFRWRTHRASHCRIFHHYSYLPSHPQRSPAGHPRFLFHRDKAEWRHGIRLSHARRPARHSHAGDGSPSHLPCKGTVGTHPAAKEILFRDSAQ